MCVYRVLGAIQLEFGTVRMVCGGRGGINLLECSPQPAVSCLVCIRDKTIGLSGWWVVGFIERAAR